MHTHIHINRCIYAATDLASDVCVCILVYTTDSSAQSEGEINVAGQTFEHYSTDPGLLCDWPTDCRGHDESEHEWQDSFSSIVSLNKRGEPFIFLSANKFTSSIGQTVKKNDSSWPCDQVLFFFFSLTMLRQCLYSRSMNILLYVRCRMLGVQQRNCVPVWVAKVQEDEDHIPLVCGYFSENSMIYLQNSSGIWWDFSHHFMGLKSP